MSRQYPPHVQRGILPETPLMNRINIHNTISVSAFRALEISHLAIKGLLACFKAASCGAARCSQPSESPSRAVYGVFCAGTNRLSAIHASCTFIPLYKLGSIQLCTHTKRSVAMHLQVSPRLCAQLYGHMQKYILG